MRYCSFLLVLFFLLTPAFPTFAQEGPVVFPWQSPEGVKRFKRAEAMADFFPLANQFESQENKIFCGLASTTIVLNAMRLGHTDIPQDEARVPENKRHYLPKGFDPVFKRYTQENVIDDTIKSEMEILGKPITIGKETKADYGLQLRQLQELLQAHGLDVTIRVVDDTMKVDTIRDELKENLETTGDYVLVNYYRPALGQEGGGHISPIGAYDEASDSFLILDVNPNAAPWVWVATADLVKAMGTFDTIENRGYLLIREQ